VFWKSGMASCWCLINLGGQTFKISRGSKKKLVFYGVYFTVQWWLTHGVHILLLVPPPPVLAARQAWIKPLSTDFTIVSELNAHGNLPWWSSIHILRSCLWMEHGQHWRGNNASLALCFLGNYRKVTNCGPFSVNQSSDSLGLTRMLCVFWNKEGRSLRWTLCFGNISLIIDARLGSARIKFRSFI
jgi:hypothetical protein